MRTAGPPPGRSRGDDGSAGLRGSSGPMPTFILGSAPSRLAETDRGLTSQASAAASAAATTAHRGRATSAVEPPPTAITARTSSFVAPAAAIGPSCVDPAAALSRRPSRARFAGGKRICGLPSVGAAALHTCHEFSVQRLGTGSGVVQRHRPQVAVGFRRPIELGCRRRGRTGPAHRGRACGRRRTGSSLQRGGSALAADLRPAECSRRHELGYPAGTDRRVRQPVLHAD